MENIQEIMDIIVNLIKESLLEKKYQYGLPRKKGLSDKYASGSLYNSVSAEQTNDQQTGERVINILMNYYWEYVQSGRYPGKKGVPVDKLEEWIKDRGLKPKKGQTIRQMAFGIMFHQKKYGIPANPGFMDVAIDKIYMNNEIEELLGDATVDDLINQLEGI